MTPDRDEERAGRAQWTLVGIVVALTAGVIVYRLTHAVGLSQTGAFFVGLPAVLAVTVALSPKARTATGVTFKAVTFGLLLAGVLVGEGFVCIVMAAPLFYLIALPIAATVQHYRNKNAPPGRLYALVLVPVVVLGLEGTTAATTLPVGNTVAATSVVLAAPAEVEAALGSTPTFDEPLPAFLRRAQFPHPVGAAGSGLDVGDVRYVLLSGPKGPTPLYLRVLEHAPGRVVFDIDAEAAPIAGWLSLRRAVVTWSPETTSTTTVRWELEFDRLLSPAFYFAPLERYAVRLAAGYLIRSVATPHG
jgi:hypothetical protein